MVVDGASEDRRRARVAKVPFDREVGEEAGASVDLERRGRHVDGRLRAHEARLVRAGGIGLRRGVVQEQPCRADGRAHLGELEGDRLERRDGAAKLPPLGGKRVRGVDGRLRDAKREGGPSDRGPSCRERACARARGARQLDGPHGRARKPVQGRRDAFERGGVVVAKPVGGGREHDVGPSGGHDASDAFLRADRRGVADRKGGDHAPAREVFKRLARSGNGKRVDGEVVRKDDGARRAAGARDFLDADRESRLAEARAAFVRRRGQAQKAHAPARGKAVRRPRAAPDGVRARGEVALGKLADALAKEREFRRVGRVVRHRGASPRQGFKSCSPCPRVILSDRDIKERLFKAKDLVVDPLDNPELQIQPASIDLRLGHDFLVFKNAHVPYIDPKNTSNLDQFTERLSVADGEKFIMHPGEFALGTTHEWLELPDDLVARVEGRSSLGRLALVVHATAGFIDPGFKGHITLELSNLGRVPVALTPGMRVSQIAIYKMSSPAERPYGEARGSKYQGQRGPTASRIGQDR